MAPAPIPKQCDGKDHKPGMPNVEGHTLHNANPWGGNARLNTPGVHRRPCCKDQHHGDGGGGVASKSTSEDGSSEPYYRNDKHRPIAPETRCSPSWGIPRICMEANGSARKPTAPCVASAPAATSTLRSPSAAARQGGRARSEWLAPAAQLLKRMRQILPGVVLQGVT